MVVGSAFLSDNVTALSSYWPAVLPSCRASVNLRGRGKVMKRYDLKQFEEEVVPFLFPHGLLFGIILHVNLTVNVEDTIRRGSSETGASCPC